MPSGDASDASASNGATANNREHDDPGSGSTEPGEKDHSGRGAGHWSGHGRHHDTPILIDESDDRWEWRRRIRADPRKARIYRIGVAVLGVLLILLGAATGPLPGPGGIPLVLLGLAVLSSEFEWAQRLMHWFRKQLQKFRGQSRQRQVLTWVIVLIALAIVIYGYLIVVGVPLWVPAAVADTLHGLPGVSAE